MSSPGPYSAMTSQEGTRVEIANDTLAGAFLRTASTTPSPALPDPKASNTIPRAPAATAASLGPEPSPG
jgi:hypothetical protein